MFVSVLTIPRKWTLPKSPTTDEWIMKCGTYMLQNSIQYEEKLNHKTYLRHLAPSFQSICEDRSWRIVETRNVKEAIASVGG